MPCRSSTTAPGLLGAPARYLSKISTVIAVQR
jgi:hypothetical protein